MYVIELKNSSEFEPDVLKVRNGCVIVWLRTSRKDAYDRRTPEQRFKDIVSEADTFKTKSQAEKKAKDLFGNSSIYRIREVK